MYLFQGPFVPLLRHTWYLRLVLVVISHLDSALSVKDTHICKCEDFPVEDRPFVAIWNAPTGGCSVNYSININLRDFDILENPMQSWDGEFVTVFYNAQLGLYPYYTNPEGTRSYNGGMPQLINLQAHLSKMKKDIIKKIPDPNYKGLAIIDWEGWRPTWQRNFDSKRIYQSRSIDIVQDKNPEWSMEEAIGEAKKEFERSARLFMETSIKLARTLRPKGLWGFYGFPDCFGTSETNYHCSDENKEINDNLKWLFASSTALYPSLYIYDKQPWNKAFAYGRLEESFRLASLVSKETKKSLPVFPYFRHLYEGKPLEFDYLTDVDLQNTIGQAADMGAAGVVMWGNRRDENTSPKVCQDINTYIETKLGPYFESVRHSQEECSENKCNGHGRCVDKNLIPSQWISEEPYLYTQTCQGLPRKFDSRIRKDSTLLQQEDPHGTNQPQRHGLNSVQRQYLIKELRLLNASGSTKKIFLNPHHKNSSKDFVMFVQSTSDSVTEVNKAPKEQKGFTAGGVVATSGLHFHDQLTESPSFTQTVGKGAVNKLTLCNGSTSGSSDCEIMKESPSTFSRGFHFPHTYVVFLCVSLGSALFVSSAFIMSYYYCNVRKRVTIDEEDDDIPRGD